MKKNVLSLLPTNTPVNPFLMMNIELKIFIRK